MNRSMEIEICRALSSLGIDHQQAQQAAVAIQAAVDRHLDGLRTDDKALRRGLTDLQNTLSQNKIDLHRQLADVERWIVGVVLACMALTTMLKYWQ